MCVGGVQDRRKGWSLGFYLSISPGTLLLSLTRAREGKMAEKKDKTMSLKVDPHSYRPQTLSLIDKIVGGGMED